MSGPGGRLVATADGERVVRVWDGAGATPVTELAPLPGAVRAVALSPDGHIWVACNASSSMVVIDPATNAVVKSIDIGLGDEPTGIAFAA